MKERTRRALELLLAIPELPEDPLEIFEWAAVMEAARRQLAGVLVFDGYARRAARSTSDDGQAPTKGEGR